MNDYEMKQEAKRQRLERAAAAARNEAENRFDRARQAVAGIPFGQPILVDHYSAKRHRAALKRQDTNMRKGIEAAGRAHDLELRAEAVGSGGISSDDPDAVDKLTDKRTDLEKRRDEMKAANVFYKKNGTLEGCPVSNDVIVDGLRTLQFQAYYNTPFPAYALSNIGAQIRDAAKRAERIEAIAEIPASSEDLGPMTMVVDPNDNRVSLQFDARLSKDDYKKVRSAGFVWSPTRGAFVRKISNAAIYNARQLAQSLSKKEG